MSEEHKQVDNNHTSPKQNENHIVNDKVIDNSPSELELRNLKEEKSADAKNEQNDEDFEERLKYFDGIRKSLENINADDASKFACQGAENYIEKMIIGEKIVLPTERKDADALVKQHLKIIYNHQQFEKNLKGQQIKEQKKFKESLENKLRYLNSDINRMYHSVVDPPELLSDRQQGARQIVLKEETEEEKKARLEAIKELAKARRERDMKREKKLQEEAAKLKEEEKKQQEKEKEEKLQREKEKREEIQKKMEELREKSEKRSEKIKNESLELKKVKSTLPLFEKLSKISRQIEQETLDDKKKKLAEIREIYRPMQFDEINEHQKKFTEKHNQEMRERSEKKEDFVYKKPPLSEAYKRVAAEHKERMEILKQEEEQSISKKSEKMREYSQKHEAKGLKIDPLKQTEMQNIIQKISHKPNYHWYESKKLKNSKLSVMTDQRESHSKSQGDLIDTDKMGNNSSVVLPQVLQTPKTESSKAKTPQQLGKSYLNRLKEERSSSNVKQSNKNHSDQLNVKLIQSQSNEGMIGSVATHKIDYLKQLKAQHKQSSEIDWGKFLKKNESMEPQNRAKLVLIEAEKIEKAAQRKEQLLKVLSRSQNSDPNAEVDLDKEIYDGYVNAIKAKLSLLEIGK